MSSGLTSAGGTEGFAAPEQRSTGKVDERTDVYAASALLTWLVLGHPPGRGDTDASSSDDRWPDDLAVTRSPPGWSTTLRRRPPTRSSTGVTALLAALEPVPVLVVAEPLIGEGGARVRTAEDSVRGGARPRPAWLAGGAVAALVGGGAGFTAATVLDDDSPGSDHGDELDGAPAPSHRSRQRCHGDDRGAVRAVVGETAHLLATSRARRHGRGRARGVRRRVEGTLRSPRFDGTPEISRVAVPSVGPPVVVDARFDVVAPAPADGSDRRAALAARRLLVIARVAVAGVAMLGGRRPRRSGRDRLVGRRPFDSLGRPGRGERPRRRRLGLGHRGRTTVGASDDPRAVIRTRLVRLDVRRGVDRRPRSAMWWSRRPTRSATGVACGRRRHARLRGRARSRSGSSSPAGARRCRTTPPSTARRGSWSAASHSNHLATTSSAVTLARLGAGGTDRRRTHVWGVESSPRAGSHPQRCRG